MDLNQWEQSLAISCLEVDEGRHEAGGEDAEKPGQGYGEIASLPGDVAVVLQGVDHSHILLHAWELY